ncbi:MAG: hypothetical protein FWF43_08545 [Propionibacteriaceae bacterium]|nr:hypothetical protein [Propionibacteriaceae bacterium]
MGLVVLPTGKNKAFVPEQPFADRAYVMETGRIVLSGSAAELSTTDDIKRVYLGG